MRSPILITLVGFLLFLFAQCSEASSSTGFLSKNDPKQEINAKTPSVTVKIKVSKPTAKTRTQNKNPTEPEKGSGISISGLGGKQPVCKTVLVCQKVKIVRLGIKKICKSGLLCI